MGEDLAEYTKTVRFGGEQGGLAAAAGSSPVAPKKRRRMSGMAWIFIGLFVFFIGAAAFTAMVSPFRDRVHVAQAPAVKSYVGVDNWDNTENEQGVTFDCVDIPRGPADQAGLVGGDIVISFDGQQIRNESHINDLMVRTPVGKTVDVEYMRDGEKKTTKLTTISRDETRRLNREFENRPEGRGQFGYEDGDAERVLVPGTNIYGVKLNTILNSRPADLAGIKDGDIVIEFDGVPIRTTDEFLMRVRRALPYSTVKVVVMRGEEKLEIPVKIGKS